MLLEDNEELVVEETNENTEQPVEQVVEQPITEEKKFTQDEVNDMIQKRLAREERKWKKTQDDALRKYKEAEDVLNQGMETSDISEATSKLKDFYKSKGITINDFHYEDDTEEDAQDIINLGFDYVVDEVDRLAAKGFNNMNPSEKRKFQKLAEYRKTEEENNELKSLGITKDDEFEEFASRLNPSMTLKEKYEMYEKYKPKKELNQIGSLKNTTESKVKDYYSPEEIEKLTDEELDNPQIWEAVRRSMTSQR